jgi:D-beta-D-heptose 7-phosphate kinase/D-beta-D-heptose 1-phosphate adenosyltransferase
MKPILNDPKIIFTNGCFDILHRGHFELLKYCKSLGYVIVGLNSDKSIKHTKGKERPFFSQQDRKFMLESCRFVDKVVFFDEKTPYNLIKELMPDIVVKGGDYKIEDIAGHTLCEVKIFGYIKGYSTTKAIEHLK